MSAEKVGISAFKADEQALKLINLGKDAFGDKALLVDLCVKATFWPWLDRLTVTRVFGSVGKQAMIEAGCVRRFGAKSGIGIEIGTAQW